MDSANFSAADAHILEEYNRNKTRENHAAIKEPPFESIYEIAMNHVETVDFL